MATSDVLNLQYVKLETLSLFFIYTNSHYDAGIHVVEEFCQANMMVKSTDVSSQRLFYQNDFC